MERIDGKLTANYDQLVMAGSVTTGISMTGTYTTGISITGTCTTGISISGTLASAASKAISLTPTISAAMTLGDGHAFGIHMSATSSGVNTGNTGALASWLNLTGTALGYNCAINTGIWVPDSGATITGADIIFGMRMQSIIGESDFAGLYPFSLNCAGEDITAFFQIGSPDSSIGVTTGTGGMATQYGSLKFLEDTNGKIYYIKLYEDAAS